MSVDDLCVYSVPHYLMNTIFYQEITWKKVLVTALRCGYISQINFGKSRLLYLDL